MIVYLSCFFAMFLIPFLIFAYFQFFTNVENNIKNEFIRNNAIVQMIVILMLCGIFGCIFNSSITYNEVRNFYITKISHQERYSKKVVYYVSVYAGKDSKGNSKYRRVRRTRTDYFGPYFNAYSNSGNVFSISEKEYNKWKEIWGEKYIKTIVGSSAFPSFPISGKYFEAYWNGKFESIYPKPEIHKYKNVLRNSNSVFGFKYGNGIKHPVDNGNISGIISEIALSEKECSEFANFNALKGNIKQVHIITVITKNKSNNMIETINKWGGLNKNELAVFIGVDNNKNIIWTDAHSWMDNTKCQNSIRDKIINLKTFNAKSIREIYSDCLNYWQRKEFKDFDYIKVKTPVSCIIVFVFTTILFFVWNFFIFFLGSVPNMGR